MGKKFQLVQAKLISRGRKGAALPVTYEDQFDAGLSVIELLEYYTGNAVNAPTIIKLMLTAKG